MADHDIEALISLATEHDDKWGDSCHHALAQEILRLRKIVSTIPALIGVAVQVERCREDNWNYGSKIEVLQHLARTALELCEKNRG